MRTRAEAGKQDAAWRLADLPGRPGRRPARGVRLGRPLAMTAERIRHARDLQARPIYNRMRDSIEAHLMIMFAALAVSRWIEFQTTRSKPLAAPAECALGN